jgi:ribonuclease R
VPLASSRWPPSSTFGTHEFDAFQRRLGAMQRDGQVMQNRRGDWLIPDKADLIRGRVEGHPDGYGFLVRDEDGPTCFSARRKWTRCCMATRSWRESSASTVAAGRKARSSRCWSAPTNAVVGRVHNEHGVMFVVAENRRISQDILLAPPKKEPQPEGAGRAGGGGGDHRAAVEAFPADRQGGRGARQLCRSRHGNRDRPEKARAALRVFTGGLAEASKLPDAVRKSDWKGRRRARGPHVSCRW